MQKYKQLNVLYEITNTFQLIISMIWYEVWYEVWYVVQKFTEERSEFIEERFKVADEKYMIQYEKLWNFNEKILDIDVKHDRSFKSVSDTSYIFRIWYR